jgi:mannan endo-1,4-beta-mannosidase
MKKRHLLGLFFVIFMFLICSKSSVALAATDANHPGFRVEGRFLYDNQGEKTILYGINKMVVWMDKDGEPSFSEIAKTGANCVRIVWTMKDGTAQELDTAITNCRAEHMIPIVELHDATGEINKLSSLVDWWVDPATVNVIKKHQEYLLINIGNEIGDGNVSNDKFKSSYIDAVTRMRTAGIHVPLLIDGSSWGQDINKLQSCGPDIITADPDANLMFSAHLWWPYMYGHTDQEVINELTESANMGLPLVVGEFANQWDQTAQGQIPYKTIMEYCYKLQIGYLIWEWGPGNNPQTFLDMTTDSTLATMQDWAKEMVFDNQYALANIVQRPASMLKSLPAQLPDKPLPYGNLAQGKPVTYSTKEGNSFVGSNITDGDISTRWASDPNSQTDWVYMDLGETKDINEVLINWENAYATQYQIQVSNDAKTWTDVYRTYNGKGGKEDISVSGSGRYVRIYCTQKYGYTWGYSIFEVGVYGPDSKLSASVSPTAAVFDKNVDNQEDLAFTLDSKANTLVSVKNGNTALKADSDYIISGDKLTITKEYLATLEKGTIQLTLVYDGGINPVINIAIGNTSPLPSLRPGRVEFNKKAGAAEDVSVTLSTSGGDTFLGILNGTKPLLKGTDYSVSGNTVTISKEYLKTLSVGTTKLKFDFENGEDLSLTVDVTDSSESSIVTPTTAAFEKMAQADINTTMILNGNTLKSILNGEDALVEGTDYTVDGNTVTISKDYLNKLSVGKTELKFVFSAGADAVLTVNVTNTVPSSSITPVSTTFDIASPTDINVELTLNGNTLDKIKNGDYTLVEGKDYTIKDTIITLSKDYLTTLKTGTSTFTFVFSGGSNQLLSIKVKDTSKVPSTTDLNVTFNNSNLSTTTNSLMPRFKITNTGSDPLDLSNVKLRYYFTTDGNQDNCFWCDWSSVGNSNIIGKFVKMDNPTDTANCYLEISFSEAAGSISPNTTTYVQCRFAKSDWTNYNQDNDYSFNGNSSNYETWDKITVYYNDSLVSGIEP